MESRALWKVTKEMPLFGGTGLFHERKIELSLKGIFARDLKAIQSFQISGFFFSGIV